MNSSRPVRRGAASCQMMNFSADSSEKPLPVNVEALAPQHVERHFAIVGWEHLAARLLQISRQDFGNGMVVITDKSLGA